MPYIKQNERTEIDQAISDLKIEDCGQLNYAITIIAMKYLKQQGIKYSNINEIIGVMECAKLEFYRMLAVPYENKKIQENGKIEI